MLGTDHEPGIYVRTINDLFRAIEDSSDDMEYEVSMSYLEVSPRTLIQGAPHPGQPRAPPHPGLMRQVKGLGHQQDGGTKVPPPNPAPRMPQELRAPMALPATSLLQLHVSAPPLGHPGLRGTD